MMAALALGAVGPAAAQEPVERLTSFLAVRLQPETGALEVDVLDPAGPRIHRAHVTGLAVDGAPQVGFATRGADGAANDLLAVRLEVLGPRAVAVTWTVRDGRDRDFDLRLESDDRTAYYGTGERFNALNQRGYTLPMVTADRYGNKGVGSYKPVPFFMSSHGFGVWVDGDLPGSFDLSATERFTSHLRLRGHGFASSSWRDPGWRTSSRPIRG